MKSVSFVCCILIALNAGVLTFAESTEYSRTEDVIYGASSARR